MHAIRFGLDQWLTTPPDGRRFGLVTNAAAFTAQSPQRPGRRALQEAGFHLVRLFAPEHGLFVRAADGAPVADGYDPLTRLPVVSLYGERMRPAPESLVDLDAVLFDLPDVGTRFYTYLWTLSHVLEACAAAGIPLILLDRPNPLGGDLSAAEGPVLDVQTTASFLGRAAIPIRHSLTLGELARLWNFEQQLHAPLEVVACAGWQRSLRWPATGLPFVPPSPAMPSYESALLYPGLGLFEATNLSVGRGTPLPFQVIGAPWLQAPALVTQFQSQPLPGLTVAPCTFTPTQNPHAGIPCAGVRLHIRQDGCVRPVAAGLRLLQAVIHCPQSRFQWAAYPTAANPEGTGHFERLIGRVDLREALMQPAIHGNASIDDWTRAPGWAERTQPHRLYA
ncbi:MAG TPA: DUF1343 domain-containing protein [Verrucomicrobiota bacterium]|nr:DUF1343 domain-containing protein [Verrucomicrobiota bacterium]HNT16095.1 DUF1343 domain-containing protein [Verrucomicrobiota bacterium]